MKKKTWRFLEIIFHFCIFCILLEKRCAKTYRFYTLAREIIKNCA